MKDLQLLSWIKNLQKVIRTFWPGTAYLWLSKPWFAGRAWGSHTSITPPGQEQECAGKPGMVSLSGCTSSQGNKKLPVCCKTSCSYIWGLQSCCGILEECPPILAWELLRTWCLGGNLGLSYVKIWYRYVGRKAVCLCAWYKYPLAHSGMWTFVELPAFKAEQWKLFKQWYVLTFVCI